MTESSNVAYQSLPAVDDTTTTSNDNQQQPLLPGPSTPSLRDDASVHRHSDDNDSDTESESALDQELRDAITPPMPASSIPHPSAASSSISRSSSNSKIGQSNDGVFSNLAAKPETVFKMPDSGDDHNDGDQCPPVGFHCVYHYIYGI
jgi:hypothetical protein